MFIINFVTNFFIIKISLIIFQKKISLLRNALSIKLSNYELCNNNLDRVIISCIVLLLFEYVYKYFMQF